LPDHAQTDFLHLDLEGGGLCMKRVDSPRMRRSKQSSWSMAQIVI
jgi:hypothetical protein